MATGEVKISALPLDTAPTADDYVATVDVGTSTTKKVPLGELSQALDKTQLLSTDADNLLTTGTDDNIRLEATADVISADAGNILQKGTDGKLLAPSVALSLTEDRMFIGSASNTPEEKTDLQVRSFLGLPTDYIKDDIQYVSANQVSWEGKCRDSSDVRDFEIVGATTASLVGAVADTTYNLFVAGNTLTDTPVVVWDIGSIPAGYTYYRRVLSIVTDGVGNIIPFTVLVEKSGSIIVNYNTRVITPTGLSTIGNVDIDMTVPNGVLVMPSFGVFLLKTTATGGSVGTAFINEIGKSEQVFAGEVTVNESEKSSVFVSNSLKTSTGQLNAQLTKDSDLFNINVLGYKDERF